MQNHNNGTSYRGDAYINMCMYMMMIIMMVVVIPLLLEGVGHSLPSEGLIIRIMSWGTYSGPTYSGSLMDLD